MQRMRVDFPEPDGPQITIRSPRCTSRLMSRSTWNVPYHLFMFSIEIAISSETFIWASDILKAPLVMIGSKLTLQPL